MNLRNFDLNLLIVFDAIIEEGSITKAAERIGMSQPAVSNALGRLRATYNDELFERTGKGMRPTYKAQQISGMIRQVLNMASDTLSMIADFDYKHSDRLFNLVLGEYGDMILLPKLVEKLKELDANIRLNIMSRYDRDIKNDLFYGKVDLSLVNPLIVDKEINYNVLLVEKLTGLLRQGHPALKKKMTAKEYGQLGHLVLRWNDLQEGTMVDQYLRSQEVQRDTRLYIDSLFTMPRIIANSDFTTNLPSRMADEFADLHGLACFKPPIPEFEIPAYLIWHQSMEEDPGHQWLRSVIQEVALEL